VNLRTLTEKHVIAFLRQLINFIYQPSVNICTESYYYCQFYLLLYWECIYWICILKRYNSCSIPTCFWYILFYPKLTKQFCYKSDISSVEIYDKHISLHVNFHIIPFNSPRSYIIPYAYLFPDVRVMPLLLNSTLQFKSRIINGTFTRGYCMQIQRGNASLLFIN
jgi:hypothetical protein